jgi:hypothetical protein
MRRPALLREPVLQPIQRHVQHELAVHDFGDQAEPEAASFDDIGESRSLQNPVTSQQDRRQMHDPRRLVDDHG